MGAEALAKSPQVYARSAGVLYLIIIVFGISAELVLRSSLIVPGDAAATAGNILASETLFRLGFAADSVVFISDVALAILLYGLLAPVDKTLSMIAAAFRLTQAAVLGFNLLHHHAALLILSGPGYMAGLTSDQLDALALLMLDLHAYGYDLGLLFFGASCLVLGYLIARSGYFPRLLGYLVIAAGFAYLIGSYTLFLLPEFAAAIEPIYVVCIVSEVALCLLLLIKGVNLEHWPRQLETRGGA